MPANDKLTHPNLPLIGGVMAAIGAGLCCVGPFVLLTLGISGAWIGNLTLLEPYRPIFIAIVLLFFGWAGWKVHRPIEACEPGTACAIPQTRKRRQIIFWITGIIALVLVTSTYWIPLIASDIE
ncbi:MULTISPECIES: mercuric transporter MerT family protein [Gammaproteobacteria]|jgi:mercuric ion transport protein|uniref:mercuric transporter MerT family protein n=1 Tax=Gammaproteobacteria TaxID=1236 RepID=UPI000C3F0749|nr:MULTISPECIES: mercuric transporter MerT family protein [Spongiibacter]MAY38676.1 mercury transporter [Spongiibacter sp.]MBM7423962.1 mercuric ion transport protein [Spongiibacter marinus]|tara:strand:+ start:95592 stop:95963 length:372 start_codon:yes stop_codon:yes gene_type:complete